MREEYVALCAYRIAITEFELQKGTILKYANVAIADGPIFECRYTNVAIGSTNWPDADQKASQLPVRSASTT